MITEQTISLLIQSVITISNVVKRSQAVKGKDREALDKATADLIAINKDLENEVIDLSDIIINRGSDQD